VAAVRDLQAHGVRSIDVGCMQVNLFYHPDAFASLNEAFDPFANAAYAARFLVELHERTGSWDTATAWYHSATPDLGEDYRRKVMAAWPAEKRRPAEGEAAAAPPLRTAWAEAPAGAGGKPAGGAPPAAVLAQAASPFAPFSAASLRAPSSLPMRTPPSAGVGRGLSAYRAFPVPLAAPNRAPPAERSPRPGERHWP
jgi:hypothetical protein